MFIRPLAGDGVHESGRDVLSKTARVNVALNRLGFETNLISMVTEKKPSCRYDVNSKQRGSIVQDYQINVVRMSQSYELGKKRDSDLTVPLRGDLSAEKHGEIKIRIGPLGLGSYGAEEIRQGSATGAQAGPNCLPLSFESLSYGVFHAECIIRPGEEARNALSGAAPVSVHEYVPEACHPLDPPCYNIRCVGIESSSTFCTRDSV